jgi:hypothetical protein
VSFKDGAVHTGSEAEVIGVNDEPSQAHSLTRRTMETMRQLAGSDGDSYQGIRLTLFSVHAYTREGAVCVGVALSISDPARHSDGARGAVSSVG